MFKKWNNIVIGTEFINESTIKQQLTASISAEDMFTTYYNIYFNVGVKVNVVICSKHITTFTLM